MKTILTAGTALMLSTSMGYALELDRSAQNIGAIFEDGDDYVELSFGSIMPSLSGVDQATVKTGNVAEDYTQVGFAYKHQYSESFSAALIFDQPYGADILYPLASPVLGGTAADLNSRAVSAIGRYKLDNGFSFHGGLRIQTISANVTLQGAAYGGLSGYNVDLAEDTQMGYLAGVAYERPDIALRVALTYFSEIEHRFDTRENFAPGVTSTTNVTTPQAVNLDFQTGVAANTLVFGSIRWADYDKVLVTPPTFGALTSGASLTNTNTGYSYNIGVGRRFSDSFSGSLSVGYEPEGDVLVSPLSPRNGNYSIGLGGQYTLANGVELSGGIRYIKVGDAQPATGGTSRATFSDNDAVAVGLKVAYTY